MKLRLEKCETPLEVKNILRMFISEIHSIKGNAGALTFGSIKLICHKIEDIIISEGEAGLKNRINELLAYCDAMREYFNDFLAFKITDELKFETKYKKLLDKNDQVIPPTTEIHKSKLTPLNILSIDIPLTLLKNLKKHAPQFEINTSFANNSLTAIERFSKENFDVVCSSYFIEPLNGVSLCHALKVQWPQKKFKFALFPSQEISDKQNSITSLYSPDIIIIKNQAMYSIFGEYIEKQFSKNTSIRKILFFEDESSILDIYKSIMEEYTQIEKRFYSDAKNWNDIIEDFKPDLIISDINMPNVNVLKMLKYKCNEQTHFVFFSGDPESELSKTLRINGAAGVFDKSLIISNFHSILSSLHFKINKD